MFELTGKKAVITGAAGDLGSAMAGAISAQGAEVVILDASKDTEAAARKMSGETGGRVIGIRTDLSREDAVREAFENACEELKGIDILLNCAGINIRHAAEEFVLEDWDKILNVNLRALFQLCQLAALRMIPQGKGKILNIASMNSFIGGYNNAAYSASKGGVGQLTKTLSNEWAQYGICVNCIAPGYMRTRMNEYYFTTEAGAKLNEVIMPRIPKGRWGLPSDLQGAAVFLCSEASDYVTGIVLPIDGGFLAR